MKGPMLEIILGKAAKSLKDKDPMAGDVEKEEEGGEEGLDVAAKEIIDAVKSGDAAALKEALMAFNEMC
jgi:hypothetical protein